MLPIPNLTWAEPDDVTLGGAENEKKNKKK